MPFLDDHLDHTTAARVDNDQELFESECIASDYSSVCRASAALHFPLMGIRMYKLYKDV